MTGGAAVLARMRAAKAAAAAAAAAKASEAAAAHTVTFLFASQTGTAEGLVKKLVKARLAEIAMVPDSKGVARDLYDDGGVKAKGRMKDGELHGAWQWWRRDGSLLRTGTFDRGRPVGVWTTYDTSSAPVKVTDRGR